MKSLIKVILSCLALQSYALAASGIRNLNAQPLDNAVMNLSQLSSDVATITNNKSSAANKMYTKTLLREISDLMTKSILTSYAALNANFDYLGYNFILNGSHLKPKYEIYQNANHESLKDDSYNFRKGNWKFLEMLVPVDKENTESLIKFTKSAVVAMGLTDRDRNFINDTAHARIEAVEKLDVIAKENLHCIDYFSNATYDMGLVVVMNSAKSLAWSSQEFVNMYDVGNIYDLLRENKQRQRLTAIKNLEKLKTSYLKFGSSCIPAFHAQFWISNLDILKGSNSL